METLFLIAGLGNPGPEYARSRHNAGFLVVERLAARWQVALRPERRFNARLGRFTRGGRSGWLCQPLTYMNASGQAVAPVARFFRVPPDRLLVIVDDADLPLGTVRLRPEGSSGGHHGWSPSNTSWAREVMPGSGWASDAARASGKSPGMSWVPLDLKNGGSLNRCSTTPPPPWNAG